MGICGDISKIKCTPPQNMDELHQRIVEECDALREQPEIFRRAVQDMHRRTQLCVARNSGKINKKRFSLYMMFWIMHKIGFDCVYASMCRVKYSSVPPITIDIFL